MEQHESAVTVWVGRVCDTGVLGASVTLEAGTSSSTNSEVNVPQTRGTLGGSKVPLYHDSTRSSALDFKDNIRHLDSAGLALVTNTENGLRVVLVGKEAARTHDERPNLSSDLDVGRYVDSGGYEISTMIKVEDLVGGYGVHRVLDGSSIIGHTITDGTEALDADEGAGWKRLVLRTGTSEELALRVEERAGLVRRHKSLLNECVPVSNLPLALGPRCDDASTLQDSRARSVLNSYGAPTEVDIVNNEGATGGWGVLLALDKGRLDTDRSVDKGGINENNRTDSLGRSVGHVDTDITVVDVQTLEGPDPVPVHEDGGVAAVECHVAAGELLVTEEGSVVSTVED